MQLIRQTEPLPGMTWREYQTPDGRKIQTAELPLTVVRGIMGSKRVAEVLEIWHRGEQQRQDRVRKHARVRELLEEGVKPLAIAHETGYTETRIKQLRQAWGLQGRRRQAALTQGTKAEME